MTVGNSSGRQVIIDPQRWIRSGAFVGVCVCVVWHVTAVEACNFEFASQEGSSIFGQRTLRCFSGGGGVGGLGVQGEGGAILASENLMCKMGSLWVQGWTRCWLCYRERSIEYQPFIRS